MANTRINFPQVAYHIRWDSNLDCMIREPTKFPPSYRAHKITDYLSKSKSSTQSSRLAVCFGYVESSSTPYTCIVYIWYVWSLKFAFNINDFSVLNILDWNPNSEHYDFQRMLDKWKALWYVVCFYYLRHLWYLYHLQFWCLLRVIALKTGRQEIHKTLLNLSMLLHQYFAYNRGLPNKANIATPQADLHSKHNAFLSLLFYWCISICIDTALIMGCGLFLTFILWGVSDEKKLLGMSKFVAAVSRSSKILYYSKTSLNSY